MNKDNETNSACNSNATQTQSQKTKFIIELYDEIVGDDDKITYRKVHSDEPMSFEASTKQEVENYINQFKMCGQRAKILKIIPPTTIQTKQQIAQPQPQQLPQNVQTNSQQPPISVSQETTYPIQQSKLNNECIAPMKKPIKYYKVGDIDIKDDNGKLYQKQWVKLSDIEASNLRLINDKNNQIANTSGKHFEMKKWILVENSSTDETTNLEENLK